MAGNSGLNPLHSKALPPMNTPNVEGLQDDACGQILQSLKKAYPLIYQAYLSCQSMEDSEELKIDIADSFHHLIAAIENIDPKFFVEFKDYADA